MKTDPKIIELITKLETIKAPDNWSEVTGPFFHLKIPEMSVSGPFMASGLKVLVQENSFPRDSLIKDAKNIKEWINIYTHPAFQRRRPQILTEDSSLPENNTSFLLVNGQKQGPLNTQDILNLLQQKEILLTDQVSFDNGHTWKKLYEYQEFDRRELEQAHLPNIPGWDVFKSSNEEIDDQLIKDDSDDDSPFNSLIGLAFGEKISSKKDNLSQIDSESPHDQKGRTSKGADIVEFKQRDKKAEQEAEPSRPWTHNLAYALAICFMLGASSYMLFNDPTEKVNLMSQRKKAPQKLIKRTKPKAKLTAQIPNREQSKEKVKVNRVNKVQKRTNRRPASITQTKSFREGRQMSERPFNENEDPYDNDYSYDDGSTPVAQDRVRKRLDKRTVDSEEQYYDEEQKDQFLDSQDAEGIWANEREGRVPQSEQESTGDSYNEEEYSEESYQEDDYAKEDNLE